MKHALEAAFERQVPPLLRASHRFFAIPQTVRWLRRLQTPPTFTEAIELLSTHLVLHQTEQLCIPGGAVVVANHPYAMLDLLCLGAALEAHREGPIHAVVDHVADDLTELHPLFAFIGNSDASRGRFWEENEARLRAGGTVLIFPAGQTHYTQHGRPVETPWRGGALKLAASAGVPVVPAWITLRTDRLYNGLKARLPREWVQKLNLRGVHRSPRQVPIRFGPALDAADHSPATLRDAVYALGEASFIELS